MSPFNTDGASPGIERITLVNGRAFVVAEPDGSLCRPADGAVYEDLRILSLFVLEIAGPAGTIAQERLGTSSTTPFQAAVVSRPDPMRSEAAPAEFFVHRQWVGRGVRHDIEVHNTGADPIQRTLTVRFDTDFAHLFDMKAGRGGDATTTLDWDGDNGRLTDRDDSSRSVAIRTSVPIADVDVDSKTLTWALECPSRAHTTVSLTFEPCWDDTPAGLSFPLGTPPSTAIPAIRHVEWREAAPDLATDDHRLAVAVESSIVDLASLRIFDEHHADRIVIAAGAPWFMTLFGRDSLLTAWMMLPFLPELAIGTIDSLADLQGTEIRASTEEEPGKIIHELRRHGVDEAFAHRGRYYGTVDATPLFVMVTAEAYRWRHLDDVGLAKRWPSIRAAIDWVRRRIDSDPSGFVRYERSTEVGLVNQGWKDSWDGVSFADGRLPTGGIALAEVQGYAYAALRDAAELASHLDDSGLDSHELSREAEELAERFNAKFWMESASSYAVGLDGDDRQIDSVTTNPGHAIWTGITDRSMANRYLDRIMDDDLFTGWGLRTLSPASDRYDPLSYHNGSVWPHDTAIVAAGAHRIGRRDVFDAIFDSALDVAMCSEGRPPELFAGIERAVVGTPVPYPSSCSPQAWASASILLHVRSALQISPPTGTADAPSVSPVPKISSLGGIRVGADRFTAQCTPNGCTVVRSEP
jgi:glycogen debranching enzyme